MVDISVIVPVYNVELYLKELLDSLLHQGDVNLEIIIIDDGSTDDSGKIADQYSEKYDNFQVHHIINGGLGNARNVGMKYATGKYVVFVDSDDIIVPKTYEKMFNLAEKHDAELTICNVDRFNSTKSWASDLHQNVFKNLELVTHCTKDNSLLYDTTAWNKLILRSFYLKNNFEFPAGILYEDIPVTIPMHILCNKVVRMNEIGYRWRVRDGATKSITQADSSLQNLKDRLYVLTLLFDFFKKNVTDEQLIKANILKVLKIDLLIFIKSSVRMNAEIANNALKMINSFIDEYIGDSYFCELSIFNQQIYEYARQNNLKKLEELLDYWRLYSNAPIIETDNKLTVTLPNELFTIDNRDITSNFKDKIPRNFIDDIITKKESFEICGHIYEQRINFSNINDIKFDVYLYDELIEKKVPIEHERVETSFLTKNFGSVLDKMTGNIASYNYDNTGLKIKVDFKYLNENHFESGKYKIFVKYTHKYFNGELILCGVTKALKNSSNKNVIMSDDCMVTLSYGLRGELIFNVEEDPIYIINKDVDNGNLNILLNRNVDELYFINREDSNNIYQLTKVGPAHFAIGMGNIDSEKCFNLCVKSVPEVLADYVYESSNNGGGIIIRENSHSDALLLSNYRTAGAKITVLNSVCEMFENEWNNTKVSCKLRLLGDINNSFDRIQIYIDDPISEEKVILCDKKIDISNLEKEYFEIDFSDNEINKNFYQSKRDLRFSIYKNDDELQTGIIYSTLRINKTIHFDTLKISMIRDVFGKLILDIKQVWNDAESTKHKRDILIAENYKKYLKQRIHNKRILFDSMWGKNYSCNPQALYEWIDENHPEYECIWAFNDSRIPIKGKGKRVRKGSVEYYYYLATSKFLVSNVNFGDEYIKRDGQIVISTMHGTPLKTLGLDNTADFPTQTSIDKYIARNSKWDYLITQGKFVEEKAYDMFAYTGEILKVGYPRTDRLFEVNNIKIEMIKEQLKLPLNKKVIFYAPTWRTKNRFDMMLDLEKMKKELSDEYILLIRLHHFCQNGYKIPEDNDFIYDVNKYRYVEDLYLIADILITDYSSVMFDYALLNRPMIFFTYDIEEYDEKLRGLYVDFKKEAPGPLCMTTEEIIESIKAPDVDEEIEKRKREFKEKYLTYEQPNSSFEVFQQAIYNNNTITKKIKKLFKR